MALLSRLRIQCCHKLLSRSKMWLGSGVAMLWCRPAAAAPIHPLAWEQLGKKSFEGVPLWCSGKGSGTGTAVFVSLLWPRFNLWPRNFTRCGHSQRNPERQESRKSLGTFVALHSAYSVGRKKTPRGCHSDFLFLTCSFLRPNVAL